MTSLKIIVRGSLEAFSRSVALVPQSPLSGRVRVREADAVQKVPEAVIGADLIDDRPFANLEEERTS
jgi:hypothetical protein